MIQRPAILRNGALGVSVLALGVLLGGITPRDAVARNHNDTLSTLSLPVCVVHTDGARCPTRATGGADSIELTSLSSFNCEN